MKLGSEGIAAFVGACFAKARRHPALLSPPNPPLFDDECSFHGCVAGREHHGTHVLRIVKNGRVYFWGFQVQPGEGGSALLERASAALPDDPPYAVEPSSKERP